jgi:hypothetical protein
MLAQGKEWKGTDVYFSLSLFACNKMQVHKGSPKEERLVSGLFPFAVEEAGEKEFRKVPWPT